MYPSPTLFRGSSLERLEDRTVPAVTAAVNAAGTLMIQGTSANDSIQVSTARAFVGFGPSGIPIRVDVIRVASTTITPPAIFGLPNVPMDFLASTVNRIEIHAGAGDDYVRNNTSLPSSLYGDEGNDVMYGGSRSDQMYGGSGNNEMHGGAGGDFMMGGRGVDRMFGDDGSDFLDGTGVYDVPGGNDYLDGGAGYDYSQERVQATYVNIERIWPIMFPPVDEPPLGGG